MSDKPEAMHTPTPWRVDQKRRLRVMAGNDDTVASTGCQDTLRDQWEANAAYIVLAVNSHARLLKEREELRKMLEAARYWIVKSGAAHPSAICNQIDATLLTLKSKD